MKIKQGFIKQQMGEKYVVVSSGDLSKEFNGMIELNITASDIWDWIGEGKDINEVAKLLSEKYDIDLSKAQEDTQKILDKMISAGVFYND